MRPHAPPLPAPDKLTGWPGATSTGADNAAMGRSAAASAPRRIGHPGTASARSAIALARLQIVLTRRYSAHRHGRIGRHGERRRGTFPQTRDQLLGPQVAIRTGHQPSDAGDDRRGEARADVDVGLVRVAVRARRLRSRVVGRIDREQARAAARVHAIAARRANGHLRPQAREADLRAGVPQTGDRGHARAVRRRPDRPALVARRRDDEHAARRELGDHAPIRGAA